MPNGAPHWPYQGPDDSADRTQHGDFPTRGSREDQDIAYKEMIESLDQNIGRVMLYLKKNNLLENTLIIFLSDNGATPDVGSNKPFRGAKSQVYEGVHRVPAVFYWEDVVEPNVTDQLAMTMDIFPTIAELLKIDFAEKTEFSGISFASIIHGKKRGQQSRMSVLYFGDIRIKRRHFREIGNW